MADLPAKPSLDHLRRQARDLLRAARAGGTTAAGRIRAVADALTLASAQLSVAREYGFASWTRLREANPLITRLLLERGAVPGDHDLHLAEFAAGRRPRAARSHPRRAAGRGDESGNTAAITLLLDLGFPVDARGDHGGTPLHAAAYSGSAPAVCLLPDCGAGVEARDTIWDSTPMEWAAIGSGEQPASHPHSDWTGTVQALLDAGASVRDITLSPDDPKPPSPEVAALLRRHGGWSSWRAHFWPACSPCCPPGPASPA